MASQRIVRRIALGDLVQTKEEAEEAIGKILNRLYRREFALYPVERRDDAIIELLIAVKLGAVSDPFLLHANATALSRVSDYKIIGTGRAVQSQVQHLYCKIDSVWRASLIALYLLSLSKSTLTTVGGSSRIGAIHRHKPWKIASLQETREMEKLFETLSAEWRFILDVADIESSEGTFKLALADFGKQLKHIRKECRSNMEWWRDVMEALGPPSKPSVSQTSEPEP